MITVSPVNSYLTLFPLLLFHELFIQCTERVLIFRHGRSPIVRWVTLQVIEKDHV